jgi:uncharacterized surface protein with fasciclin (FAS1) repeats
LDTDNPGALDFLTADPEGVLTSLINYHVVPGRLTSAAIAESEALTTVQGGELAITVNDEGVPFVNGARIVTADIPAKNGVIHIIDEVLLPAAITLPAAVETVETVETVTATPVNPPASTVIEAEVEAGGDDTADVGSIVDVLTESGNFTSLLGAFEATDLTESFSLPGNYTLFAPTDAALESFNSDNLTSDQLKSLLLFHVVGDQLTRDQLATDDFVPSLSNGRPIAVNRDGSMIQNIGGAKVLMYNVPASNGIIHVIDSVMIP